AGAARHSRERRRRCARRGHLPRARVDGRGTARPARLPRARGTHDRAVMRRPRGVLFDMDGLILDTEPLALRAWSECARALGVPFDAALGLRMVGRNFTDCSELLRAHYAPPYPCDALLGSWHSTYDAIVARDGVALKAGVAELLDWLDEGDAPRACAREAAGRGRARSLSCGRGWRRRAARQARA